MRRNTQAFAEKARLQLSLENSQCFLFNYNLFQCQSMDHKELYRTCFVRYYLPYFKVTFVSINGQTIDKCSVYFKTLGHIDLDRHNSAVNTSKQ